MKDGYRPAKVAEITIHNFNYFGREGFLDMDTFRLVSWAYALNSFKKKIENIEESKKHSEWMFSELCDVCQLIYKRFSKK